MNGRDDAGAVSGSTSVRRSREVTLDVALRQSIHAVLPDATLPQVRRLIVSALSHQARLTFTLSTRQLIRDWLPLTTTLISSVADPDAATSTLPESALPPPLRPFLDKFVDDTIAHLMEFSEHFLTDQCDRMDNAVQSEGSDVGDNMMSAARTELVAFMHRLVRRADRHLLIALNDACQHMKMRPTNAVRSQTHHPAHDLPTPTPIPMPTPTLTATPVHRVLADNVVEEPVVSVMTDVTSVKESTAASAAFTARSVVLSNGVNDALCQVLAFIPLSRLLHDTSRVSRHFFAAANDARCWRNIDSVIFYCAPDRIRMALFLRKLVRLETITFGPANDPTVLSAFAVPPQLLSGVSLAPPSLFSQQIALYPFLPKLKTLSLAGCTTLNDDAVLAFIGHNMNEQMMDVDTADEVCPSLSVLNHLTQLDLSDCTSVSDIAMSALAPHLTQLRRLNVSNCRQLTVKSFKALANSPLSHRLERLDVSGCRGVNDQVVAVIAQSFTSLQRVSLKECWTVSGVGLQHLCLGCPRLSAIELDRAYAAADDRNLQVVAPHLTQLTCLSLVGCNVSDDGISVVSAHCRSLVSVDVSSVSSSTNAQSDITDSALQNLAKNCSRLTALNVSGCTSITDSGIDVLAKALTALTVLNVSKCSHLTDGALHSLSETQSASKHSLCRVHLSLCYQVSDGGIGQLLRCPRLEQIDVGKCVNLTDRSLGIIAMATFNARRSRHNGEPFDGAVCALKQMDFRQCRISDRGLKYYPTILKAFQASQLASGADTSSDGQRSSSGGDITTLFDIREMSVSGCRDVSDDGVIAFIQSCSRLLRLDLSGTAITDRSLLEVSVRCASLTCIELSQCVELTDAGVLHVTRNCRELRVLVMDDLPLLTDDVVTNARDGIAIRCDELTRLVLTRCARLTVRSVVALANSQCLALRALNMSLIPLIVASDARVVECRSKFTRRGCTLTVGAIATG